VVICTRRGRGEGIQLYPIPHPEVKKGLFILLGGSAFHSTYLYFPLKNIKPIAPKTKVFFVCFFFINSVTIYRQCACNSFSLASFRHFAELNAAVFSADWNKKNVPLRGLRFWSLNSGEGASSLQLLLSFC